MTPEQLEVLRVVADGGVRFDPRMHGFCGAPANVVGDLDALGLLSVDWTLDLGVHPRYPRHPVVLTEPGRAAIDPRPAGAPA